MIKLEKIAIQTTQITCENPKCKAIFTAELKDFLQYCNREGICYKIQCPKCKTSTYYNKLIFVTRYVTPSELRKEKRKSFFKKL